MDTNFFLHFQKSLFRRHIFFSAKQLQQKTALSLRPRTVQSDTIFRRQEYLVASVATENLSRAALKQQTEEFQALTLHVLRRTVPLAHMSRRTSTEHNMRGTQLGF